MVQAKPTNWSRLLADAVQHQRSGRFSQAEAICRQVLRHDPDNTNANHMLGLLAHQAGDNGAAVTSIGKAIAANPRSALYRFNLGIVLAVSGEVDAAIESYREALALKPDYAAANNNLGLLLDKLERMDEAAACFEQATRIAPNHVEAWVNLGKALQGQAKPGGSRHLFRTRAKARSHARASALRDRKFPRGSGKMDRSGSLLPAGVGVECRFSRSAKQSGHRYIGAGEVWRGAGRLSPTLGNEAWPDTRDAWRAR